MARRQTHPNHLAALATLLGMQPAPLARCRLLDIGCGDGSNLIPIAYQLPQSEFVGFDLSAKQIATGQAHIAALGLRNISLQTQDILRADPAELGQFDYITAYGVYSWVPPEVKDRLLALCRACLAPQGVAYISYNAYPGWYAHQLIREMMLYYTRDLTEPYERAKQARKMLDFLTRTIPTLSSNLSDVLKINQLIYEQVQRLLRDQPDEYLLHDHLEASNQPLYLHQFLDHAARHGLQYLTDAESSTALKKYLPAQFMQATQELARTDEELEQLIDFLYLRAFRQTLLCHQEVSLRREITPAALRGLLVASAAKPVSEELNVFSTEEEQFRAPIGTTLTTEEPVNKAALRHLAEIWPWMVSFDELLTIARARLHPDTSIVSSAAQLARDAEALGSLLLKGYALNLVELHVYTPDFTLEVSDYPKMSDLARFQARDNNYVVNQRHEVIALDDEISHYLLADLDGRHHRQVLLDKLVNLVEQGALVMRLSPEAAHDSDQLRHTLQGVLDRSLQKLAREALMVG